MAINEGQGCSLSSKHDQNHHLLIAEQKTNLTSIFVFKLIWMLDFVRKYLLGIILRTK